MYSQFVVVARYALVAALAGAAAATAQASVVPAGRWSSRRSAGRMLGVVGARRSLPLAAGRWCDVALAAAW